MPKGRPPGPSRFPTMNSAVLSTDVGSWPPMKGWTQGGGNTSGGGLGCGANSIRFSKPVSVIELVDVIVEVACLWLDEEHTLPDPDWQPKGEPSLKTASSEWPSARSEIESSVLPRTSRSSRFESRVSVKGPLDPPLSVQAPGVRGGISLPDRKSTLGSLREFEPPSSHGQAGL